MLGSETAETNLRTLLLPRYSQLLGVDVGERDCGNESADAAVTMLFAAVGGRCWGARLRRCICGRCCYPKCPKSIFKMDFCLKTISRFGEMVFGNHDPFTHRGL